MKLDARAALILGMLAVSSASILFRFSSAPPFTVAAYRLGLAALMMSFFTRSGLRQLRSLGRRGALLILISGMSLAIHFGSWFASLRYTTIAASTVIVTSSPLVVLISSWALLHERPTGLGLLGTTISFVGMITIFMGHIGGKVFGDLLALLGMLSVTVYFLIGRILRKRLATFPYVTAVYGTSAFFLIIFAMVNGDALTGYAPEEYLIFLLLALIPSGIGHTSYNYALKYLKAYVVSISVLGEPLLASLLAMPIFGEVPSFTTALGGLMIGSGMYITLKYEKRNDLKS